MKCILDSPQGVSGQLLIKTGKNFLLNTIPALLLLHGKIELKNYIPYPDVKGLIDILSYLGISHYIKDDSLFIDTRNYQLKKISHPKSVIRSSFMVAGAMLSRDRQAHIPVSYGWCTDMQSNKRDCNFHIECFRKMGVEIKINSKYNGDEVVQLDGNNMKGTDYTFPKVSVTGTVNAVLAALGCQGETILQNISIEPEVIFTIELLKSLHFHINLHQESRTITVTGDKNFTPIVLEETLTISLPADRIIAGSMMTLTLMLGGELELIGRDIVANNLKMIEILKTTGGTLQINGNDSIIVKRESNQKLKAFHATSAPFPEVATDLLPFLFVLAPFCQGVSELSDHVYNIRLLSLSKLLQNFNVNVEVVEGNYLKVHGIEQKDIKKIDANDENYIEDLSGIHNLRGQTAAFFFLLASGNKFTIDFETFGGQIDRGYPTPYLIDDLKSIGIPVEVCHSSV